MSSFLLKCQAKSLSAHVGDENHHGFLVGTCNLRGPNELRLLRYYEDDDEIECIIAYSHPRGEILQVSPCPFDATIVATVYSSMSGEIGSAIWKLNNLPLDDSIDVENSLKQSNQTNGDNSGVDNNDFLGMSPNAHSLELIAELPFPKGATNQMVSWSPLGFHPVNQTTEFVTVDLVNGVSVFELALPSSEAKNEVGMLVPKATIPLIDVGFLGGVNWDPHHPSEIAIACDSMVLIIDIKSATVVRTITNVVPQGCVIRSISYNPNKPWFIATGGDDYLCKIWDIRRPHLPVKILAGHTHWVTCVAFNPFHDQLILTSSSDVCGASRLFLQRLC
jgi:EARP and GARP complex-interacting protein 1